MNKLLLLCIGLVCYLNGSAQSYAYNFSGHCENQSQLVEKLAAIPGLSSIKLIQKDEQTGHITFDLSKEVQKTDASENPDALIKIKQLLQEFQLTPSQLVELNSLRHEK